MDGAQVSKTPPSLIAVPRRHSMEVLPAPLEGASVSLRKNDDGSSSSRQRYQQRSSLAIPAPSPPPQTISSGDASGISHFSARRSQDTARTRHQKTSASTPLIGIGPESPTFISSPTGLLTISTGLSPTKGPCRGSLASAASGSPGPVGYYPSSSDSQPRTKIFAASPSAGGAFTPHSSSAFGAYPSTRPLYMTTKPAAAVAAATGCGSELASNIAGLPQGQIDTEGHDLQGSGGGFGCGGPATQETSCGGASFASLDSSSFFAITQRPPSSTSDLADLTHPDLERMLLRQSPETVPAAAGGMQMTMITGVAQQQHHRTQTTVNPGPLRDFDTFDIRLVDGSGSDDFPPVPVVGGLCGGFVGGGYESSDESSGENAGRHRCGIGLDNTNREREIGSSKLEEGGDGDRGAPRTAYTEGTMKKAGENTSAGPHCEVATVVLDHVSSGYETPPSGSGSGLSYGLSSLAAYRGAISRGRGGPGSRGGRGRGGRGRTGGRGGVAVDGNDTGGGPRQNNVGTGAVASSRGASPRSSRRSTSPPRSRAPNTSSVGRAAGLGGALRDASRGGLRGRGGGRGRGRGNGRGGGGAAAAKTTAAAGTSPRHRVVKPIGVATESSTAGRGRGSGVDGDTVSTGGGEDGSGQERCSRMVSSERQEHAQGISAPSLLHGHPLARHAPAGQRQASVHEGRQGDGAEGNAYFPLAHAQQQQEHTKRQEEPKYGGAATPAGDAGVVAAAPEAAAAAAAAGQRDTGGIDDETAPRDADDAIDGELQHEIRNGTLFGIDFLGGIGDLDEFDLADAAAAAASAASASDGEEEDDDGGGGGRHKGFGDSEPDQSDTGAKEEANGYRDDGDDDGYSGSGSDANSDANSPGRSGLRGGGGSEEAAMMSGEENYGGLLGAYEAGEDDGEDEFENHLTTAKQAKRRGVGGNGGRVRRTSRKKVKKPVWSQLRKACDRCTSKKVKCDGKEGCFQCSRAGATCHFSICRRSGPRDSNGHKTGTLGPIIPRDGYEKVTGRRGSCRTSSPCRFAFADGQSKTEHYHCRTPGCEYASKTMDKLMSHRQEHHPESARAIRPAAAAATATKQQQQQQPLQQQKRAVPPQQTGGKGTLQHQQQRHKKPKLEAEAWPFLSHAPVAPPAVGPEFKPVPPQPQPQQLQPQPQQPQQPQQQPQQPQQQPQQGQPQQGQPQQEQPQEQQQEQAAAPPALFVAQRRADFHGEESPGLLSEAG